MSSAPTVSPTEVHRLIPGMLAQLKAGGVASGFGSLAEAMEVLGLWDFVFNQALVTATSYATSRQLANIVHPRS